MKTLLKLPMITLILFSNLLFANNARVTNVLRLDAGGAKNEVSFDLSWDNSWSVGGTPGNHDAIWVFIKFRECGVGGIWNHGLLDLNMANHTFGATVTNADTISLFDRNGTLPGGATASNGLGHNTGILIKRSIVGVGNIVSATCTLKLMNPSAILDPAKNYDIRVFGIEMVEVLTETFPIGGNGTADSSFTPNSIDSEAGIGGGVLYTGSAALPAEYPKGFKRYYCMKYEISQSQFGHFLNHSSLSGGSPMDNFSQNRNGLTGTAFGAGSATPSVAQNYMKWNDLLGYLDWAALRPMTEFEYEKASTGPAGGSGYAWGNSIFIKAFILNTDNEDGTEMVLTFNANANCYAPQYYFDDDFSSNTTMPSGYGQIRVSGSAINTQAISFEWFGIPAASFWDNDPPFEGSNDANTDKFLTIFPFYYPDGTNYVNRGFGPLGVGIFARDSTLTRFSTGGSYYGAMELSGNVSEQCVSVTSTTYEGTWGNGHLVGGQADNADWPVSGFTNRSIRGGGYGSVPARMLVADRLEAENTTNDRIGPNTASYRAGDIGGRGVR